MLFASYLTFQLELYHGKQIARCYYQFAMKKSIKNSRYDYWGFSKINGRRFVKKTILDRKRLTVPVMPILA
jgi:hypothetical protein